ncbi:MAG: hypothetical protein P9L89_00685 [Candidatus Celaenobacter polaris]|nr:hypothetical protein [Candidatus Celaenobacter polaris]
MKTNLMLIIFLLLISQYLFAEEVNDSTKVDSLKKVKKFFFDKTKIDSINNIKKPYFDKTRQDYIDKNLFENPNYENTIEDNRLSLEELEEKKREEREEALETIIFTGVLIITAAPVYLPIILLDDDYSDNFYFQNYPFEINDGFIDYEGKSWMANISTSTQYVNKNIWGYRIEPTISYLRLSLESSYSYYLRNVLNDKQNLSTFESLILFSFAQNQFINFRTGFGFKHLQSSSQEDGIKWAYKIRIFKKPFNINIDYGLLLYNLKCFKCIKTVNEFNIGLGVHIKRIEFKLGYRFFKIIDEKLNGPEFVIRFWM